MATHFSILAWRIPTDRGAWRATVHGVSKSQTSLSDEAQHRLLLLLNYRFVPCSTHCVLTPRTSHGKWWTLNKCLSNE